jgi:hypothetical protein
MRFWLALARISLKRRTFMVANSAEGKEMPDDAASLRGSFDSESKS